ncbi:hypothetical protein [Pleionea sp. CnH1-48]|uniref:hypothetical protein n=1 Tax=Pleionea sp. CnH1-48 TaxID=2954494 RepID=UPI002098293F|nr:hypothetical protein [Pleionea sp. CnH1-48]MCO7222703.1 hypothetical protein [Pleionea sp. CnH1-48]
MDECRYRWVISPASGYVVFVAESANDPARKVEVYIGSGINQMWLEFPSVDGLNLKVITPKDAAAIIRQALKLGWIPDERGAPFVFDYHEDGSISRRQV